jgi:hypothetical protein
MKVFIKNSVGYSKPVKLGFSWTMFFFGFFVPLFRGDIKWAILSFILAIVTCGLSWLVLPFIYNKIYIKEMFEKGWIPGDDMSKNLMKQKGMVVPG